MDSQGSESSMSLVISGANKPTLRLACGPSADDGYRLYIMNLPSGGFSLEHVATLYRARWALELLFRELKSQYGLGRFQTQKKYMSGFRGQWLC
jgi:IS4 transposase